jgi:quercetin dioxygenase-like cupin family protein
MRRFVAGVVFAAVAASVGCRVPGGDGAEVGSDPVVVAPDEFAVALENERVRVLRVTVKDGTAPGPHSHPGRVVVFLTPCTWLERGEDGAMIEETNAAGEVHWMGAMVHKGGPHQVKETCELLEIELK